MLREGERGLFLGGGMHSLNFGCDSGEYFQRANDEILVILQTESPTGVANAEAIYSLPGVDAIFVGPVDLRAQMRKPDGTVSMQPRDPAGMQNFADNVSSPSSPYYRQFITPVQFGEKFGATR